MRSIFTKNKTMYQMDPNIRPAKQADLPFLKQVIDTSELFPSEMLEEMMAPYFAPDENGEYWITYELDGKPSAVAYFAPEKLTNGTFNLYLIAVHAPAKGQGIGGKFLHYVEQFLKDQGARILIIETSGLPEYEGSRAFYRKHNYQEEARIREFYDAGDDKVVFWKAL